MNLIKFIKIYFKYTFIVLGVLVTLGIIIGIFMGDNKEVKTSNIKPYEIVKNSDISYIGVNRFEFRVLVSPEIKENQIKLIVNQLISEIREVNQDKVDIIHLFLYSDKSLIDGQFDVAMADWDKNTNETKITVKENLEQYLTQRIKNEVEFGLTEQKRREIFKEIYSAEIKSNYDTELKDSLWAEIRTKHKMSEDIQFAIMEEAMKEMWPKK